MTDRCPLSWRGLIKDDLVFLEAVDPDWKDHFFDAGIALDFYFDGMNPMEFIRVMKEIA